MIGQSIDITKEAREPTEQELMIWNHFVDQFSRLEVKMQGFLSTTNVAARLQGWLDLEGIPLQCFTATDQAVLDGILYRYNMLGRLKVGVETHRYWTAFEQGDLVIAAPPGMPREQYENDIYPGVMDPELGALPLVIVGLIWGAVLITGAIAAIKALDYMAENKDRQFRDQVLKTDREMLKADKPIRDAWQKMKETSKGLINEANITHTGSWFESLTTGAKGAAIGGFLVLIGLFIAWGLSRGKR